MCMKLQKHPCHVRSTWESGKHETESMVPSLLQRTMLLLLLCSLTRARQRGNSRRAIGFVRPPIAVIFVAKCSHHSPLHHLVIIHSGLPLHAADFSSKISPNSGHCEFDRQFGSLPPIFQVWSNNQSFFVVKVLHFGINYDWLFEVFRRPKITPANHQRGGPWGTVEFMYLARCVVHYVLSMRVCSDFR